MSASPEVLAYWREMNRMRRELKATKGECADCYRSTENGRKYCTVCIAKQVERRRARRGIHP